MVFALFHPSVLFDRSSGCLHCQEADAVQRGQGCSGHGAHQCRDSQGSFRAPFLAMLLKITLMYIGTLL